MCTKLKDPSWKGSVCIKFSRLTTSRCYFDLWPLTLKSNRCRSLVRGKCTNVDSPSWNCSVCIVFTRVNNNGVACDHDLWLLTLKTNRCRPLVISGIVPSLRVLAEIIQYRVHKILRVVLDLDLWSLTLKRYRCPLSKEVFGMCTKSDGPGWNVSVCIVFTRFYV